MCDCCNNYLGVDIKYHNYMVLVTAHQIINDIIDKNHPAESLPLEVELFLSVQMEYERELVKRLVPMFDRQETDILNLLKHGTIRKSIDDITDNNLSQVQDNWDTELEEVIIAVVLLAMSRYAEKLAETSLFQGITVDFSINNPELRDYIGSLTKRIRGVNDTTITLLKETLTEGIRNNEGIPGLTVRVRDVFSDISRYRAITIARTEMVSAVNRAGLLMAYKNPKIKTKRWQTILDGRERLFHAIANGQTVRLTDTFTVGGESLLHPGDPNGSPQNIINCRCTMIYGIK